MSARRERERKSNHQQQSVVIVIVIAIALKIVVTLIALDVFKGMNGLFKYICVHLCEENASIWKSCSFS